MDMFEQPAQSLRPLDQSQLARGGMGMSEAGYVRTGSRGRLPRPDGLAHGIETDIVPRLLLARRGAGHPVLPKPDLITGDDVARFTDLVLADNAAGTASFLDMLRGRGILTDALFIDLLGPSALLLGTRWEDDTCSFGDVTLAMIRLQRVLRELTPAFHAEIAPRPEVRRALLVPAPGEQHGMGLRIVAEFLRRAGWQVVCGTPESRQALLDLVRQDWFAMVGLSTACSTAARRATRRSASWSAARFSSITPNSRPRSAPTPQPATDGMRRGRRRTCST
jgi:methanogenic corrinoid protein MtbC1